MVFIRYSIAVLALAIAACGKKHKNIFSFKQAAPKRAALLSISSVKGVVARSVSQGVRIEWHHVDDKQVSKGTFVGYNVYRLTLWGVVPRQPLNPIPCFDNWFVDTTKKAGLGRAYAVKALIRDGQEIVFGPMSKVTPVIH